MKKVLTFIMAGGKGERLSPLTKDITEVAYPSLAPIALLQVGISF